MKSLLIITALAALVAFTMAAGCVSYSSSSVSFCAAVYKAANYKVYDASFPASVQQKQDKAAQDSFNALVGSVNTTSAACNASLTQALCFEVLPYCASYPSHVGELPCSSICTNVTNNCPSSISGGVSCSGTTGNCFDGKGSSSSAVAVKASFLLVLVSFLFSMVMVF